MIFTFAPELTVRSNFVDRVIDIVAGAGSRVRFVELTCPLEEVYRHIDSQSRRQSGKNSSHAIYEKMEAAGVLSTARMPPPDVPVDTRKLNHAEPAAPHVKEMGHPKGPRDSPR